MALEKKYYRSLEEYNNPSLKQELAKNEFAEEIPVDEFLGNTSAMEGVQTSRRDFLKILGFSTAAVTLAACEAPIIKSVPYVTKPDAIIPGIPNYYASTLFNGSDFAHVLVKTREGRPIKIESNKKSNYFSTTSARVQASVLSLYDNNRVKKPMKKESDGFAETTWEDVDAYVQEGLAKSKSQGKKVVVLTPSLPSPTTKKLLAEFTAKHGAEHVVYDVYGHANALDAAEEVFGQRVLPFYDLSKAQLVVSFYADFLNDWNGGGLEAGYAAARKPGKDMLKHIQIEGNMSMTGANADKRYAKKPSEGLAILAEVYEALQGGNASAQAKEIANELRKYGSKAVVFADGNKEAYVVAHAINALLSSEVMAADKAVLLKEFNTQKFNQFISDVTSGNVGMVLNFQTNPVYGFNTDLEKHLSKIQYSVGLAQKLNETQSLMKRIAPVPHWLECWGDFNPVTGVYSLQQPTIQHIFDTRQFEDSLLKWMGSSIAVSNSTTTANDSLSAVVNNTSSSTQTYYNYLRTNWEASLLGVAGVESFNRALYEGFAEGSQTISISASTSGAAAATSTLKSIKSGKIELQLYTKNSIGDGTQANNPWLQELPDPITRASWDNYVLIHPTTAQELGFYVNDFGRMDIDGRMQYNGEYAEVSIDGKNKIKLPVFVQPGQAKNTIGVALGYGQNGSGKVAETGVNVYPFYKGFNTLQTTVNIEKVDGLHEFACIQMQNTVMGRYELAREVDLKTMLSKGKEDWNPALTMHTYTGERPIGEIDLWDEFDSSDGPKFNLSVDLNTCTGCAACIVACQAENNVPVVGKDEVRMSRDMYWLRIDRYYTSLVPPGADTNKDGKLSQTEALLDDYSEIDQYNCYLEHPETDNPEVIFQPVMCQHCNHAPCETVCPVAATSHGKQGQNHMAYNRCVGTRYCANNCPYKVRRFNWLNYALNDKFDYNMNNDVGRMVLNPDVVVRARGVMEKCSLCIQMTQATILEAKKDGRRVADGEFQTACTNACPTGALQFGDINDPSSHINELKKDDRKYELLEEVGTKPNVFYHFKVRNN